jgi:hypothetical protein
MSFDYESAYASQHPHRVVPAIPLEVLRGMSPQGCVENLNARAQLIEKMAEDRLRHTYRPPAWRRIDLEVARKRLAHPGACIELFVLGGHDSGKTDGAVCAVSRHFFYTPKSWCWGLHSTQDSSKTIHQARVWDFWPPELKAKVGRGGGMRRTLDTKMKYGEGQGFTNDQFNVKRPVQLSWHPKPVLCGGLFEFKFFASKVDNLQGSKITSANSDELVDKRVARTVKQRMIPRAGETRESWFLREIERCVQILETGKALPPDLHGLLYTGVHIMGFTPMQGYSPLIAAALDGAKDTETVEAAFDVPEDMKIPAAFPCVPLGNGKKRVLLLPLRGPMGEVRGCAKVPRFKQPKRATQLVAYLHTADNPWTNIEGKLEDLASQNETEIRITFFGDVRKNWQNKFSKFTPALMPEGHLVTKEFIKKVKGTWYHTADFATGRNWFMIWTLVDAAGRKLVVREWPQAGDYIPENDVGDPEDWAISEPPDEAVSGEKLKRDGYPGPAQKTFGLGFAAMKREIERVEREIGEWYNADKESIEIEQRLGDSRLGNNPTPTENGTTSIIDEMADIEIHFDPASGKALSEGDDMITDALSYDTTRPMGPMNSPTLLVNEDCAALRFTLSTYTGADGAKAASKDPRDALAMMLLGEPVDVADGAFSISRGKVPYAACQ